MKKKAAKRKLFGTDGIRGKANLHPMTCEVALSLGRAVTYYFQQEQKERKPLIVIGKDTRLSCYALEQAFSAGVCSQGGRAILTGPLPTPGVAFVTKSMRACAGVMISASHNSFSDNGIKIFDKNGHKLPDNVELELEEMILDPSLIPLKLNEELGNAKRLDESIGRYIVHVKSAFPTSYSLEGMRIVLDCANGAAYKVAPLALEELGAEVIVIGNSPNGRNINDNCGSTYPSLCASYVEKYRADLGVCLDGDGDRVIIVNGEGEVLPGDKFIGIMSKYLKDKGELKNSNEIVGTVMTNIGLEHYLNRNGMKLYRTQVGDRYIFERMVQSGALFGGEPSGHLIFRSQTTTGDGLLATLKLIECLKFYKKSLVEIAKEVELYPQVLKNVEVRTKPDFANVPTIKEALEKAEKKLGQDGRVLLRYSGTEPKARVMLEGKELALLDDLCNSLARTIARELGESK